MLKILIVAVTGGLGSVARYLLSTGVQSRTWRALPLGTFCVNVVGCFIAGIAVAAFAARSPVREEYRLAVLTGFLGGFTTFSAFGVETFALMRSGRAGAAALNVTASIALGLCGVWLGYKLGTLSAK